MFKVNQKTTKIDTQCVCGERKLTGVRRGGEVGLEWWEEAKYYLSLLFYLAVIHGMDHRR